MKSSALYIIVYIAIAGLWACDVIEPDIRGEKVQLLLPADSSVVNKAEVNFQWESLEGSRNYRLQVASPSFKNPIHLYLDTVITGVSFIVPLQPGAYEWRVQALNAGYETSFSSRFFTLDSASNLSGAVVRLLTPSNEAYINNQVVQFSWEPVALADKYILELSTEPRLDTVVYTTSVKKTLPQTDKLYKWRVTALNATGVVNSPEHTFTTDFTPPPLPELLHPAADTVIFNWPVQLEWRRGAGDVIGDSLFLYLSDQRQPVNGFPKLVANTTFALTADLLLAPGDYYWAVKSLDRAGNSSGVSAKRKFSVR